MNKKLIFRALAGFLSIAIMAAGILLLTPVFETILNKVNGLVFIALALFMARYALTGKERLFTK